MHQFHLNSSFHFSLSKSLGKVETDKENNIFQEGFFLQFRIFKYSFQCLLKVTYKTRFKHKTLRTMSINNFFYKIYHGFQILNIEHQTIR